MKRLVFVFPLLLVFALVGCGGGGGSNSPTDPNATVTIHDGLSGLPISSAQVPAGGTKQFSASVQGVSDGDVTWSIVQDIDCGMITQGGLYTAPSTPGTVHVKATSSTAPTASAYVTVTILPGGGSSDPSGVTVAIFPELVVLERGESVQFAAMVGGTLNTAVTWEVLEGAAGGTITSTGWYTAPSALGEYNVRVRSVADPTKTATALVVVADTPPMPPMPPGW